jgi:hypothetical protein
MSGETDLNTMLCGLKPSLQAPVYVFCTVSGARYGDLAHTQPVACMVEAEGLTLVVTKESADQEGLAYQGTFRCIRLGVHSSLQAVGLTAAVSKALASQDISANMIAGYYHDHVFVPSTHVDEALEILRSLEPTSV